MELGQRIKQARLDAGLSQRQLCGDEITRNMLSQIENGSARPSMDTLRFLASRLGKPVSFFLEEAAASPNQAVMDAARKAYASGDLAAALNSLQSYQTPDAVFDGEYYLLRVLIFLAQAESETDPDRIRQLLSQAANDGHFTPYYTPELERRRLLCLAAVPEDRAFVADSLVPDDRELLLRAQVALERGNIPRSIALLEAVEDHTAAKWLLLRADAALAEQDLATAGEYYHRAESIAPELVYPKLEQFYLQQEDFKQAYFYACKQR